MSEVVLIKAQTISTVTFSAAADYSENQDRLVNEVKIT